MRQSNTCPKKKSGFQLFSPKTRRRKNVVHQRYRHFSNLTLPVQLYNKQTDPANAFAENRLGRRQWGMSNLF